MNSSSEKRTISINPDVFRLSSSKTRRRKDPATGEHPLPKLKVRDTQLASRVNKSIKNHVLKYMRDKHRQQERNGGMANVGGNSPTSVVDAFDTDFKQSLDYLNSIAEKQKTQVPKHNATVRNMSQYYGGDPVKSAGTIFVDTSPDMFQYNLAPTHLAPTPKQSQPSYDNASPLQSYHSYSTPEQPKYGCLKNGSLPTYRMLKQQTVRLNPTLPSIANDSSAWNTQQHQTSQLGGSTQTIGPAQQKDAHSSKEQESFREWMKNKIGQQKLREKRAEVEIQKRNLPKFRKVKQKKTIRRTFYLGKSEKQRSVAVLVSNKTLRREIESRTHQLKQTPIEDIRKCLIKKGFIKIGSTAPNDVLRKMYESISTLCGDIKNHNSENIVYNYLNAPATEDTR